MEGGKGSASAAATATLDESGRPAGVIHASRRCYIPTAAAAVVSSRRRRIVYSLSAASID